MHAILWSCFQGKCNSVVPNYVHEVNTLSANNENLRHDKNIDAFMYLYIYYACGIPWTLAFIHSFNKQAFYPKAWFKLSGESKYLHLKSGGLSIRKLEISGCILQTKRWLNGLMTSMLYKALISKGSLPWSLMLVVTVLK